MRSLAGASFGRASAAVAIVGVAGVMSIAACGIVGTGGSDGTQATGTTRTASPAASPSGSAASPADAAKITDLARYVVLTDTGANTLCREKLSAKFVATVFHTVKRCRHAISPDAPDNKTQDIRVTDIRVSGPAATATITEVGGEWADARGTWAFIRTGENWSVAAWGVDYLRSAFKAQYTTGYHPRQTGDLISDPTVRGCLSDKLQTLDDETFTAQAFGMFRGDKTALKTYSDFQGACELMPGPDGLSAVRRNFDAGLKAGATKAGNGGIADCVSARLRKAISDREIQDLANSGRPAGDFPAKMLREITEAGQACAQETPASPTRSA